MRLAEILPLVAFAASGVFAQTEFEQVRELNAKVLALQAQAPNPEASQQAVSGADAGSVFSTRLSALTVLIERDPERALLLAFPKDLIEELGAAYPQHKAKLETYGDWQGPVESYILEGASLQSIVRLRTGSEDVFLHFAGWRPSFQSRDVLSVRGVRAGSHIAVEKAKTVAALAEATDLVECSTLGDQKIAVILVNFKNAKLPANLDANRVRSILLGNSAGGPQNTPDWSVDDFWQQNSGGKTRIKQTGPGSLAVVGPYNLAEDVDCDFEDTELFQAATSAANKDLNYKNFARLLFVLPEGSACAQDGSTVDCGNSFYCAGDSACGHSWGWLKVDSLSSRSTGVSSAAHSLGHQLGLGHAASLDFGAEALGPLDAEGTRDELGDPYSVMGLGGLGFYSAPHAIDTLGWFEKNKQFLDVSTSGAFSIDWMGKQPAGLKALKIQRGHFGNPAHVFVEFRQNKGIYDSTLSPQVWSGGLVHYAPNSWETGANLVDFTPASVNGFNDPALAAGKTWEDPHSNLTLKVDSIVNEMLNVTVTYGPNKCIAAYPDVEITPRSLKANVGSPATYTVTVTNQDSPNCEASFNLSSLFTTNGWAGTFDPPTLTLKAGASATSKFTVTPPADAAGATHIIEVNVTHAGADKTTGRLASCSVPHIIKPGPATEPFPPSGAVRIDQDVTLNWKRGDRAIWHKVYLGTTNPPLFLSGSPVSEFRPKLLEPGTKYYWRIEEQNEAGINDTSPVWSFTTKDAAPGKPWLSAPLERQTVHTVTPRLSWKGAPVGGRPVSYDVYFGTAPSPPLVANVPQVKQDLQWRVHYAPGTLEWGTRYYWRIVAKNEAGATSSDIRTFLVKPHKDAPDLKYPYRGSSDIPRNAQFEWSAAGGQIASYKLYVGTTTPPPFVASVTGTTFKFPSPLEANTKYFWQVVAVTTDGKELISAMSWFTTK
jgi:hypothetical protein